MAEVSEQTDVDEGVAQTASFLAVVARALHVRDAQLQPTLDAIVSAAASALNEGRDAGLILLERGTLVPQATTGRAPLDLDLQQQAGEGPCIEAARRQAVIRIDDTRSDPRWPALMAEARLRLMWIWPMEPPWSGCTASWILPCGPHCGNSWRR